MWQEREATNYITSAGEKQSERNEIAQLPFSSGQDPWPIDWCCPYLE